MLIIGHRGARALEPENTLRALRRGMECADYVEIDLRLSRDGVPVVMHDAALDRTTNGTGPVADRTHAELKLLDAGKGERIPAFSEVLDLVRGRSGLVVEIKEPGSEGLICRMLAENGPDGVYVVSFHPEVLVTVRRLLPGAQTGYIYSKAVSDPVQAAVAAGADVLLPRKDRADREVVRRAHDCGLLVFVWTLNTDEEFEAAAAMDADGFATDDPCSAREFHRRYRGRSAVS
jgi:glycerophosphoryl diester phosphodiesterase